MTGTKRDMVLGIGFALFGLTLWFIIIPAQVQPSPFGDLREGLFFGPELLPRLVAIAFTGVGILLFLAAVAARNAGRSQETPARNGQQGYLSRSVKGPALLVFVSLLHVYLLPLLGYVVATALATFFFLLLFHERRKGVLLVLSPLLSLGLFLFFRYVLLIRLPMGTLFRA